MTNNGKNFELIVYICVIVVLATIYFACFNVSQKGYGGRIKAEVIFENDKIISIKITSHHETPNRYQLVIDEDYLNKLINNQNDLENLDTVSSATVTSNALKKMIINVLEYEKSN